MQVKSTSGRGDYEIIDDKGNNILTVKYKNWFSSTASTLLGKTKIEIKSKNIWGSKFDILKDGVDCGDIIFNWKGHIIIRLEFSHQKEKSWIMRTKGFWSQKFHLYDEDEKEILILNPDFNWSKVNYNYIIEGLDEEFPKELLAELLIYACYGANLYITTMFAAV